MLPTVDAVALRDVEVRAAGRRILGPVSLRIQAGERWMLLGPNGSGKTTLLSVAGGWRHPSGGRAWVLGAELGRSDVRDLRARIGHVGHRLSELLRPDLSVDEVVLTGKRSTLAPWGVALDERDRRDASARLAQVGCGHLAGQAFLACSQGERQRVLLARALFARHELLVLDEPAAGLDLPGREAMVGALEAVAADGPGPTTIMATHHLDEAPPSTTHAALLRDGLLVAAGPVDEVLTAAALGRCFGIELRVERRGARWTAFAADGAGVPPAVSPAAAPPGRPGR